MVRDYKSVNKGIKTLHESNFKETEISKITNIKLGTNTSDRKSVKYFLSRIKSEKARVNVPRVFYFISVLMLLYAFVVSFLISKRLISELIAIILYAIVPIYIVVISLWCKYKKINVGIGQFGFMNFSVLVLCWGPVNVILESIYKGHSFNSFIIVLVFIVVLSFSISSYLLDFKNLGLIGGLLGLFVVYLLSYSYTYPESDYTSDYIYLSGLKKDDALRLDSIFYTIDFKGLEVQENRIFMYLDNLALNESIFIAYRPSRNFSSSCLTINDGHCIVLNVSNNYANVSLKKGRNSVNIVSVSSDRRPKGIYQFALDSDKKIMTGPSLFEFEFIINEMVHRCIDSCIFDLSRLPNATIYIYHLQNFQSQINSRIPLRRNFISYPYFIPNNFYRIRIDTAYRITEILQVLILAVITGIVILLLERVYFNLKSG